MKFENIPAELYTVRLTPLDNRIKIANDTPVVSIQLSSRDINAVEIAVNKQVILAQTSNDTEYKKLNSQLGQGNTRIAVVSNQAPDSSFDLRFYTFQDKCLDLGSVDVGVDEYVVEKLAKHKIGNHKHSIYDSLGFQCIFKQGENEFFFIITGLAAASEAKTAQKEEEKLEEKIHKKEAKEKAKHGEDIIDSANGEEKKSKFSDDEITHINSFGILGERINFVATEKQVSDDLSVYAISRFRARRDNEQKERAIRLAKGKLRFVDWSQAGQIQYITKAQLGRFVEKDESYLKHWDEYGRLEGDILLENARKLGSVQYSNLLADRQQADVVTITLENLSDETRKVLSQSKVASIEMIEGELPSYLRDANQTFDQYIELVLSKQDITHWENPLCTIKDFDPESNTLTITVDSKEKPLPTGIFIMNILGDLAQIKRRMRARKQIIEGRAVNPQLGLLIEDTGKNPTFLRDTPKLKPLTAFVKNKIFAKEPTERQIEAIQMALNTPDIALIQGPPGTGKTTVITAILERLNEEANKENSLKGRILLSGFQHDAVNNMISRMSINGLPVPKFGKRQNKEDYDQFEKDMATWCSELAKSIRSANPQLKGIESELRLRNECIQYVKSPSTILANHLVEDLLSVNIAITGESLHKKISTFAKKFKEQNSTEENNAEVLRAIRNLRISSEGFKDDGADNAYTVLEMLEEDLEKNDRELLEQAANDFIEPTTIQLAQLKDLRRSLLKRFTAQPVFTVDKQNDELLKLVIATQDAIRHNGSSVMNKKEAALLEFVNELEANPQGMINAVSDYSYAFAATCQQSVNKLMQKQKGLVDLDGEERLEYDYVIVDEAARVTPRDLMVAMVQGKKIILVGDHRQLPQMIDDDIAQQMEAGELESKSEKDWLKQSMFEYLFSDRLKALEEKDPEHKRYITLDTQYRMHPTLGDFISENFYEKFSPKEKFMSGRPASDFVHNLPGTNNVPVMWIDVPSQGQRPEKAGTSLFREAEATVIAQKLEKWLSSEEGEKLTFGVISFYSGQVNRIQKQFAGRFDENKLKIGTVDSFQGMEFDVVFLSIVRTMPNNVKFFEGKEEREKQARKLFGFLCLYNRLNVAMSRQKKLLVVVGDSALVKNELASEDFAIPGLVNFYKLCKEQGVIEE